MPAPSTIVTFADADGDEFPMRVWMVDEPRDTLVEAARKHLDEMIHDGRMRPTLPVTVRSIEAA